MSIDKMNRDDPQYVDAIVKKKSQADPKEDAIRTKIGDLVLREPWAQGAFQRIRQLQIDYLKDVIANVGDADKVHDETQKVLGDIATLLQSEIVEGAHYLQNLSKGSAVLIVTNHFGPYKLVGIDPKADLGVDIPGYDAMYPSPMYFAALKPVSDAIGNNLYYVSEDFPLIFGQIHTNAGFIHVPPAVKTGRAAYLEQQTGDAIQKRPNSAIVNFPEGGTSGKYTGLGPYDLDPFKTGGYVIAAKLGIPVIPVAQYFDKDKGMQLRVFEPYVPQAADKAGFDQLAERDRQNMQAWLDQRKGR